MNNGNLWQESSVERIACAPLQHDLTCDLVIIGGGYTGTSAALSAASTGARVVLLEGHAIGHGGSGRNVGLVNAGLWLPPEDVCDVLGQGAGQRLNEALARGPGQVFALIAQHDIACEPVQRGTLHCAHAPKGMHDLTRRHAQLMRLGAPVTLLSADDAKARCGTERVHGALFDARAGTVQPLAYVRGLARAAIAAGAQVFEHSAVRHLARIGSEWQVTTPGGRVSAPKLLMATNAYHDRARGAAMPRTSHVNYFQIATEPLGDNRAGDILPGGEGCWDTGLIMTSFRRDQAGRIILGGMGDDDTLGLQRGWAARMVRRYFPQVADVGIRHAWAGRIAMSHDKIPKVLSLGPGALAVFGYSGRGIAPGTVLGQSVAKALLSESDADLPVEVVDQYSESMPGMKSAFYETGARLAHLLRQ